MAKPGEGPKHEESIIVPELGKMNAEANQRAADEARGREAVANAAKYFGGLWNKAKAAVQPVGEALAKVPGLAVKGGAIGVGAGIRGAEAAVQTGRDVKHHLTDNMMNRSEVVGAARAAKHQLMDDIGNRSEVVQAGKAVGRKAVEAGSAAVGAAVEVGNAIDREAQKAARSIERGVAQAQADFRGAVNGAKAHLEGWKNVARVMGSAAAGAFEAGKNQSLQQQFEAQKQQLDAQWDGYMNQWAQMSPEQRQAAWDGMDNTQKFNCNAAYARATQRAAEAQRAAERAEYMSDLSDFQTKTRAAEAQRAAQTLVGGGMA